MFCGSSFWARPLRGVVCAAPLLTPPPLSADMVGHGGVIRSISLSRDGSRVLTASFDHSVRLWQFDEQRALRQLAAHAGPVNAAAFSRGGGVSVGADGAIVVWDLERGSARRVIHGRAGRLMSVALSRDRGTALTGAWDGSLAVWDLGSGEALEVYHVSPGVTAAAFGPGDRTIVAGMRDGLLRVLRRPGGAEVTKLTAHDIALTQLHASLDRSRLLTIGHDGWARVWDTARLRPVMQFKLSASSTPISAAIADDAGSVLVGYLDGRVLHLDVATGTVLRELQAEPGPVWAVALTPDARFALSAGPDERVKVWHLPSGDRIDAGTGNAGPRPRPWLTSSHPGARVFRKCAVCHALTEDEIQRAGPHLQGLFGRHAGSIPGYRYSDAVKRSKIIWNRSTLTALFREGPDRYLPGTKMPVQEIRDPKRLRDLVDYLEQAVRLH